MTSRRDLKKALKLAFDLGIDLCCAAVIYAPEKEKEVFVLIDRIYDLRFDIISRISHTEPGNVKAFYKKLNHDFRTGLNGILEELNAFYK